MLHHLLPALPAVTLAFLGALGAWMRRIEKMIHPPGEPFWPFSEKPGLALELADSAKFIDDLLGPEGVEPGETNRKHARKIQTLDFVFIPLYVTFFFVTALQLSGWLTARFVLLLALVTGVLDVMEDLQILGMLRDAKNSSAKRFGRLKWMFYFATLAAEGSLTLAAGPPTMGRTLISWAFSLLLIGVAIGGIVSSSKASFDGIASAAGLSMIGLVGLGIVPLVDLCPASWGVDHARNSVVICDSRQSTRYAVLALTASPFLIPWSARAVTNWGISRYPLRRRNLLSASSRAEPAQRSRWSPSLQRFTLRHSSSATENADSMMLVEARDFRSSSGTRSL